MSITLADTNTPALESLLAERMGLVDPRIVSMVPFTEGWSMETFALTVESGTGQRSTETMIVRREPVRGLLEPYDIARECRIIEAVGRHGIPTPRVYAVESDPAVYERCFGLLEQVHGEVPEIQVMDTVDCFEGREPVRKSLADHFVRVLAQIHRIDLAAGDFDFLGQRPVGNRSALDQVEHWAQIIDAAGYRDPAVTLAVEWLRANAPQTERPALVHCDYRTGNFIARDGEIAAVLDWEMAHVGGIHEDLTFTLNPLWHSPGDDPKVCHLVERNEFLQTYQELSGYTVEENKLVYFDVLLQLKSVGIAATAVHAFTSGELTNLRLASFGYHRDTFRAMLLASLARAIGELA
ncbi:MAG TPA: phosphotransferase family protein [Aldersonia sp.]